MLKLKKIPASDIQCSAISLRYKNDSPIGLILCSQEFIPVGDVELSINEMKMIMSVMENFSLYYNNISEVV